MRKVLVGGALLILISGAALLTPTIRDLISTKQTPAKAVASKTQTKVTKPRDPKTHDFSDVDYAQKKLIHHQLGAMIADKEYRVHPYKVLIYTTIKIMRGSGCYCEL